VSYQNTFNVLGYEIPQYLLFKEEQGLVKKNLSRHPNDVSSWKENQPKFGLL